MRRDDSCSHGLSPAQLWQQGALLGWESAVLGARVGEFPLNSSTAKHLEWKSGSRMHPGTSALCCPSKIKGLEMFGFGFCAGFILIFVAVSVWEELWG